MSAPLVSAVIIFLNGRPWLSDAAASVLSQDYQPLELILVDDGSSDGSWEIAEQLVRAHDGRVQLVCHPGRENRGMSASRNRGVAASRGEYVGFLDADDIWLPGKISQQATLLERHPQIGMVYGRTALWHAWHPASSGRADEFCDLGVEPDQLVEPPELFLLLLANQAQTPTTCNALIRRAAFDSVRGFEEQFRGLYEDQVFFGKLHLHFPTYVASAIWARYRQDPLRHESRLRFSYASYYRQRRQFTAWLRDYVQESRFATDERVVSAVEAEWQRSQRPYRAAFERRFSTWFGSPR